ncbi:MAG: DinB family protein [Saprospiraceae bacterium]|nr:DinB family protein [Saprospiraceae bacterium]
MEILDNLRQTKQTTLAFFELSELDLQKSYGPGKWTIREILHHLADAETVLYDRIRRAIAEPGTVIWAFDQDKWCEKIEYAIQPLGISQSIYASVREGVINLANQYYVKYGDNQFIHSESGLRTLKDEFDKVAWHNERHLQQIKNALET